MNKKISTVFAISMIAVIAVFLTVIIFLISKNVELIQSSALNKSIAGDDKKTALNSDKISGGQSLDKMASDAEKPEVSGLEITNIKKDQLVASPLTIKGRARGSWFFEGEFPVKLMDEKGNFFVTSFVTAKGEWMTENWVPFEAKITFQKPATKNGFLFFAKNNPSGMPQNDYSITIPIKFGN